MATFNHHFNCSGCLKPSVVTDEKPYLTRTLCDDCQMAITYRSYVDTAEQIIDQYREEYACNGSDSSFPSD